MSAIKSVCLLLLLLLAMSCAVAAELYVDQGNPAAGDGNPGSAAHPWKTLTHASQLAKDGDTVWVKQGVYTDTIAPVNENVTFQAYADDHVILCPPIKQIIAPSGWRLAPGTRDVYQCQADTSQADLLVDGTVLDFTIVKGKRTIANPNDGTSTAVEVNGTLTDGDTRHWTTLDGGIVQINLNGDDPAQHQITLRDNDYQGIKFDTNGCCARGFDIRDGGYGAGLFAANDIVEDCLISGCYSGVFIIGANARADVVRRCTLRQNFMGINAGDGPGTDVFEENLIIGSGRLDWKSFGPAAGLDNPYAFGCGIRFGNINFCVIRYNTIVDGIDVAWWPDVNCYSTYYYGNTITRLPARGIYNEYPSNGSQILYNAVVKCDNGITSRFAWHLHCMYNYLADNKDSGLAIWGAHINNPYIFDNVYAKNIVLGSHTCLSLSENGWLHLEKPGQQAVAGATRFRMESNELLKNIYQLAPGGQFADFDGVKQYATLAAFQQATGMEQGSQAVAQPNIEDLSLRLFTVRIPDSSRPYEAVPLVGNPVRQGIHSDPLPVAAEDATYFWRQGDAAQLPGGGAWGAAFGADYEWLNSGHPVRALIRAKDDADPTQPLRANADPQVWLECLGSLIDKIPADGSGFWSPILPTVPGAHIRFSFQLSGNQLKPVTADGGPVVYIRFQTQTGQHVQRVLLFGKDSAGKATGDGPCTGTFPWRTVVTEAVVPDDAKQFAVFFGLKPAEGAARYANFRLDTLPAPAPVPPAIANVRYVTIDLTHVMNRDLDTDTGGALGAPPAGWPAIDNDLPAIDLAKVKAGIHVAGAIPFQLSRAVSLRCSRRPPFTLPVEANGIAINRPVAALYFLHAGPPHMRHAREYWRYIVHYADGAAVEVVPVGDTADIHYYRPYFLSDATEVQAAAPSSGTDVGEVLRWVNPRPLVAVTAVDFRSMDTGQAVLLAITAAVPR